MSAATGADTVFAADYLAFAHQLADLSDRAILPRFRTDGMVKDKAEGMVFDPVTAADRDAEAAIREAILAAYPDHGIEGEEFGTQDTASGYSWVIDPIDGTRSFIMGLPVWGTLIGLTFQTRPLLGVMSQPFTQERYWSSDSHAYYRGPDGEREIATRPCSSLGDAILACTTPDMFSSSEDLAKFETLAKLVRMRRFGGDCYAYCQLAAGNIDIIVEAGLAAYDIVALIPIVERAGGRITSWDGGDAAEGGRVAASGDPALHDQVLDQLSA